ncbi:MAG TPA: pyridoxamine 5'-phosphate oxidase family protein [Candidatus Aenigmarchaeota archaeon]|nr:pyridoxamine 5'-phosphate oxidase family protein [Candidatus Aenigmarchaeota archaeon]
MSIASVDANNHPTVTPIGSLFLNDNQTGFYFEKFPSKLPKHAEQNNSICVLGVNSNRWFWIKSLYKVVFKDPPAIKLYGTLGKRRKATEIETNRLARRMRATKRLEGHDYLWGEMCYVRDVAFTRVESIKLGKMIK